MIVTPDTRRKMLALIHINFRDWKMQPEKVKEYLYLIYDIDSLSELDVEGLKDILDHMESKKLFIWWLKHRLQSKRQEISSHG